MLHEVLECQREIENTRDRYAVSVLKNRAVVGHLPSKISKMCSIFLRRGGKIKCEVSGSRRYSADLPQGGMEIPCILLFEGKSEEIKKIKRLFR